MPIVRLAKTLVTAPFRSRLRPTDASTVHFLVWPNDLDMNRHMNNGRYLTLMDLGRFDLELGGRIDLSSDRVFAVSGKLEEAEDAITEAQQDSKTKYDAARFEQDEERKKQLQEEAARAQRKVDLLRITYKRLEAECIDIVKEAEALDISRFELNQLLGVGIFP